MIDAKMTRIALAGVLLAVAGFTAACETDAQRAARLERQALEESGKLDELKESLETVNPDPYDPKNRSSQNIGRFKKN